MLVPVVVISFISISVIITMIVVVVGGGGGFVLFVIIIWNVCIALAIYTQLSNGK